MRSSRQIAIILAVTSLLAVAFAMRHRLGNWSAIANVPVDEGAITREPAPNFEFESEQNRPRGISVADLHREFAVNDTIALDRYAGKTIRVEGYSVVNRRIFSGESLVGLADSPRTSASPQNASVSQPQIICAFHAVHRDIARAMKMHRLTVIEGQVRGFENGIIAMSGCKLIGQSAQEFGAASEPDRAPEPDR
jgi:hypothetical protein